MLLQSIYYIFSTKTAVSLIDLTHSVYTFRRRNKGRARTDGDTGEYPQPAALGWTNPTFIPPGLV